jgi:outer membrane murein-binding lipoprotein Lpp
MSARGRHRWPAYHFSWGERSGILISSSLGGDRYLSKITKTFFVEYCDYNLEGIDTKYTSFVVMMTAVLAVVLAAGCTSAPEKVSQLTVEQKELAISQIKHNTMVQDAAITQDGKHLSLAIIVEYATNEETAKDLGDSFLRLVKTFGPEDAPQKEIGPGIYDYLVGVYYPDKTQVALGAKCSSCRKIAW